MLTRILAVGIFILCAGTAWIRGGGWLSLQWPALFFALLLCGAFYWLKPSGDAQAVRGKVAEDPVFRAALCFLLLLSLQMLISGFVCIYLMRRPPDNLIPFAFKDFAELVVYHTCPKVSQSVL